MGDNRELTSALLSYNYRAVNSVRNGYLRKSNTVCTINRDMVLDDNTLNHEKALTEDTAVTILDVRKLPNDYLYLAQGNDGTKNIVGWTYSRNVTCKANNPRFDHTVLRKRPMVNHDFTSYKINNGETVSIVSVDDIMYEVSDDISSTPPSQISPQPPNNPPTQSSISPQPPNKRSTQSPPPTKVPALNNDVLVSSDGGVSWVSKRADPTSILVIGPGAGTFQNAKVYDKLRNQGYKIIKLESKDGYPRGWQNNQKLNMMTYTQNDLLGLATDYDSVVGSTVPHMLICGSRGCQVTVGKIWQHFWRGPSIIINGGCLMSNTLIPKGVFPVIVSATDDYFATNDDAYVRKQFKRLSSNPGVLVRLLHSSHMPEELSKYIVPIATLTVRHQLDLQQWQTNVRGPHIEILNSQQTASLSVPSPSSVPTGVQTPRTSNIVPVNGSVLDLPSLQTCVLVDPAGSAFDGRYTFTGAGFSGAIYSKFHINGKKMRNHRHNFTLTTGNAIWNPNVDEVIGIVHAIGPDYSGKQTDPMYFQMLENTFDSIRSELQNTAAKCVALPLISSSIYRPTGLNLNDYMKFYIKMINTYLSGYTVYLNLFTADEMSAYTAEA